jgi:DNA-binding GntR family transcriptional regulator
VLSDRSSGRVMLGTQVYEALRAEITRGVVAPGEKLAENEIAARFGVSRTPTREALRRLETEGLAERRGPTLHAVPFSREAGAEILLIRQLLEPTCGSTSAPLMGPRDLIRLDAIVREMAAAVHDGPIEQAELNNRFHDALYARCPHRRLLEEVRRVREHSATFWLYETYTPEDRARVVNEHVRIVELAGLVAHRERTPDALAEALDHHIGCARERFDENARLREGTGA